MYLRELIYMKNNGGETAGYEIGEAIQETADETDDEAEDDVKIYIRHNIGEIIEAFR